MGDGVCDIPQQSRLGVDQGRWALDPTSEGIAYKEFCRQQRQRLNAIYGTGIESRIRNGGYQLLFNLFADSHLPGGSRAIQQGFHQSRLSAAAERLEFVLWYMESDPHAEANDSDFARELRDQGIWSGWVSNQLQHFLTAVQLAYEPFIRGQYPVGDFTQIACMVTHEQMPAGTSDIRECYIGSFFLTDYGYGWFHLALQADSEGDTCTRDLYLRWLAPNAPEDPLYDNEGQHLDVNDDPYRGNSMQDLRLSLKGWIFGKKIRNGEISTLQEAQTWIRTNLRASQTRQNR